MYDLHTHTVHSDGKNTVNEMCLSAIEKGMSGLAITDHADMRLFEEKNVAANLREAEKNINAAKKRYCGKLNVLRGVELGDYGLAPAAADRFLAENEFDVVLYSEHFVPKARWTQAYSRIVFDNSVSDDEVHEYMKLYFDVLNENVDRFHYDVLGHISCPARYITGRQHRDTDVMRSEAVIKEILKKIIDRDIALELNTCGRCCESFGYYDAQNEQIFALYRALGGTRVTLGSDAHAVGGIGRGFAEAKEQLRQWGFDRYYYYENRNPVEVSL